MSAHMTSENSVIRHYKKELIHRQHEPGTKDHQPSDSYHHHHQQNGINDPIEPKNGEKLNNVNKQRTRRKRKNRNCRGQFRHEGMELIKLGTNTSHSLCKTKEPFNARVEKSSEPSSRKEEVPPTTDASKETKSVIHSTRSEKTIILETPSLKPAPIGHSLPQMVPERRNSREMNQMVPERRNSREMNPLIKPPALMERRNSTELNPLKLPHSSPTRLPPPPEYRVPIHPTPTHPAIPYMNRPLPFVQPPLPLRSFPRERSPHLAPPPPYPGSPPHRPVPLRTAFRPAPIVPPTYFPFARHNGFPIPPPPRHGGFAGDGGLKRKPEEAVNHQRQLPVMRKSSTVTAIDLTSEPSHVVSPNKRHKCHCECGKTYTSDPVSQEVIITVAGDSAPGLNLRGKMVDGVLKLESRENEAKSRTEKAEPVRQNGAVAKKEESKIISGTTINIKAQAPEPKPSSVPLFLIKDLLEKDSHVEKKSSHHRLEEEVLRSGRPTVAPKPEEKPISHGVRVIVSPEEYRKREEAPKSQDYSINSLMATERRRPSADVDTISISSSSSSSESAVRSPKPKVETAVDKQIPQGKLFYHRANNSFIRYFEDAQKKLFYDNLMADGKGSDTRGGDEGREIIELPKGAVFSAKDSLTVEEYVSEMTLAEKFIPKDFFLFYKFVTGYQICNNHPPVSFLIFLKMYNTNGLKSLLERYVNGLKQAG